MKIFPSSKRDAYFLLEILIAIVIAGILFSLTIPVIERHNAKRELLLSSQTLTYAIRTAQMDAKSEIYDENLNRSSKVTFHCEAENDGKVHWYTTKGGKLNHSKGCLSEKITSVGVIHLTFDKDTITPSGQSYEMILKTKNNRHAVKITVALYTGRVKTEILS